MSAIAGMLRFDGCPVSRPELERVASALRAHGPDRAHVVVNSSIGFVHVLMRMTVEDQFDHQPYRGPSGSLITADMRLDNRDEMLIRIGLTPGEVMSWPDSRVLLWAWEKLGDAVWPMLRGPFAVAIWNPQNGALTLARDPIGLNVVMWHRSERFFAFATMPIGLFALSEVRRELSEEKFADFLVLNHADHATTIYKDVFRVRPAHFMRVDSRGATTEHRYWSTNDIKPVRLSSEQEYADGLRERLDLAVRRQLRSAHPIGCLLSGGLDSSSVAVLAAGALAERNQRLAAFTGVPRRAFDEPLPAGHYADETRFVDAIAKKAENIDVTYVPNEQSEHFDELERFFAALEGPIRNPTNLGWVLTILQLARTQGRRVLLGGLHGNYTISWSGWSQAFGHLLSGRWLTALRQWQLYYLRTPHSRWTATRKLFLEPAIPAWLADWVARHRHTHRTAPWQVHSPIRPEFAAAMRVESRAKKNGHDFCYRARRDERVRGLLQIDYGGDWRAAEKAVTGVEVRDPTVDLDVLSYCFGVPPEQYLAEGTDRSLIRRAMWGLLPESVLTNRLHGLQAADWYKNLDGRQRELACEIALLSQSSLVRRMIDVARLERAMNNWPKAGWYSPEIFIEYNLALMRGVAGGRFLRWFESTNCVE